MQNFLYCFMEGQTHTRIPRARYQNEFDPQWTDIESSLFKPLHRPSMPPRLTKHGNFCMQNNQLGTKILVELTDNMLFGFSNPQGFILYQIQFVPLEQEKERSRFSGVKD